MIELLMNCEWCSALLDWILVNGSLDLDLIFKVLWTMTRVDQDPDYPRSKYKFCSKFYIIDLDLVEDRT